nr:transposase [Legionella norrlandica]
MSKSVLGDACLKCDWLCHSYCLMTNHYHSLIETPFDNLSKGMRYLNGYTLRNLINHISGLSMSYKVAINLYWLRKTTIYWSYRAT